jgi:hypothetical protein
MVVLPRNLLKWQDTITWPNSSNNTVLRSKSLPDEFGKGRKSGILYRLDYSGKPDKEKQKIIQEIGLGEC